MYNPSLNWMEQVKYIAREMIQDKQFVLEGTVTSVDPNPPYKVKVNLEPYGVETGWLRVATPYAGNGFGLILPPPDEGTPVKVIFDMGDVRNGTVIGELFSDATPGVPFGTAGIVHKSGSKVLLNPDGSVSVVAAGGAAITLGNDGSLTLSGGHGGSVVVGTDGTVSISGKSSSQSW